MDFTSIHLPNGPIATLVWTVTWSINAERLGPSDAKMRKKYHSSCSRFARRMLRIWPSLQRFVYRKNDDYVIYTLDENGERVERIDPTWHDAMWQCIT